MTRFLFLLACLIGLTAAAPIDWWNVQRRGGNSFNGNPPDQDYFIALAGYGGQWVRLTYDKWKPERRDFLIGSADRYEGLVEFDLRDFARHARSRACRWAQGSDRATLAPW